MSTAFLNKVYDVYENRDYFGVGCDNLNPVREVKSSQAEVIDEDQVLEAVTQHDVSQRRHDDWIPEYGFPYQRERLPDIRCQYAL